MNKIGSLYNSIGEYLENHPSIIEFLRFCVVGATCTLIDAVIYYTVLLIAPYQVALVSGYLLSLIVNYILTIYWTFQKTANVKNAIGVVVAHLINLFIVRMGLMYLFVNVMQLDDRIAYLPTLVISMLVNFIMVRFAVKKFS